MGGGGRWVGSGVEWEWEGGGATKKDTFNNGSNQNNVSSNWLSVEMLFYTKALVSSLGFQRAEFYSLLKHTHREADWELKRLLLRAQPLFSSSPSPLSILCSLPTPLVSPLSLKWSH